MWNQFLSQNKISDQVCQIVAKLGYTDITKVQKVVIPLFVQNKDVIVKACTGSGKTLSFLVPLFNYLSVAHLENQVQAVILLPTRELASQVFAVVKVFLEEFSQVKARLLIGGSKSDSDFTFFKETPSNVVVGTPGRFCEVLEETNFSLKQVQVLILDEADKMFDLGLEQKILSVIEKLPKMRRTGIFSATMNSKIESVTKVGMRNPVFIDVTVDEIFGELKNSQANVIEDWQDREEEIGKLVNEIPLNLENKFIFVEEEKRLALLVHLISTEKKAIIFFASCNCVNFYFYLLSYLLPETNFFKLHGKIDQKARTNQYRKFSEISEGILLSTDLAARGIDVPDVNKVIQYDPPKNEEIFVHRVGRTARAGKTGESIMFLRKSEERFIKYLSFKGISLKEETAAEVASLSDKITKFYLKDRLMYDKALASFVSQLKFYSEHDLKYIFDINTANIGGMARNYSLFRVPRVKEILGKKIDFQNSKIDPNKIQYKDANARKMNEHKRE